MLPSGPQHVRTTHSASRPCCSSQATLHRARRLCGHGARLLRLHALAEGATPQLQTCTLRRCCLWPTLKLTELMATLQVDRPRAVRCSAWFSAPTFRSLLPPGLHFESYAHGVFNEVGVGRGRDGRVRSTGRQRCLCGRQWITRLRVCCMACSRRNVWNGQQRAIRVTSSTIGNVRNTPTCAAGRGDSDAHEVLVRCGHGGGADSCVVPADLRGLDRPATGELGSARGLILLSRLLCATLKASLPTGDDAF